MPLKPKTIEKIYWTIGEVAEELGVNTSSIRFWEREFGTITPKRTNRGDRLYTRKEIDHLRTIQHLVKDKGFTLHGAKSQLKQGMVDAQAKPEDHLREVAGRLSELRAKLLTLRGELGPAALKGPKAD
ncbi:MAG: MerR family transcriptional regulator [Flavobacteriales bacterium]|nr:MerR family transcriptional regulator [Flavobacteriales bacterium]